MLGRVFTLRDSIPEEVPDVLANVLAPSLGHSTQFLSNPLSDSYL